MEMLGVIKLVPVPTTLPNVGASYQVNVPTFEVAFKVRVPASHLLAGVVEVTVATV